MRVLAAIIFALAALPACVSAQEAMQGKAQTPFKVENHTKTHAEIRPFDSARDASADVDIAINNAKANGTKALIVMGANWCHDSRGLAGKFHEPKFKALLAQKYELVYVNVGERSGQKDANPQIAERFGVGPIVGTPTVVITSGDGNVLNPDSAGFWRKADSLPFDITYAYFAHYAGE